MAPPPVISMALFLFQMPGVIANSLNSFGVEDFQARSTLTRGHDLLIPSMSPVTVETEAGGEFHMVSDTNFTASPASIVAPGPEESSVDVATFPATGTSFSTEARLAAKATGRKKQTMRGMRRQKKTLTKKLDRFQNVKDRVVLLMLRWCFVESSKWRSTIAFGKRRLLDVSLFSRCSAWYHGTYVKNRTGKKLCISDSWKKVANLENRFRIIGHLFAIHVYLFMFCAALTIYLNAFQMHFGLTTIEDFPSEGRCEKLHHMKWCLWPAIVIGIAGWEVQTVIPFYETQQEMYYALLEKHDLAIRGRGDRVCNYDRAIQRWYAKEGGRYTECMKSFQETEFFFCFTILVTFGFTMWLQVPWCKVWKMIRAIFRFACRLGEALYSLHHALPFA